MNNSSGMIHTAHHKPSDSLHGVDFTIMKQSLEKPPKGRGGLPSIGGFQDTTGQGAR